MACRDSLDQLQAAALKERDMLARSERGAGKQGAQAGNHSPGNPEGSPKGPQQASSNTSTHLPLERTLQLLGSCRKDELQKLLKLRGKAKVLGVYR